MKVVLLCILFLLAVTFISMKIYQPQELDNLIHFTQNIPLPNFQYLGRSPIVIDSPKPNDAVGDRFIVKGTVNVGVNTAITNIYLYNKRSGATYISDQLNPGNFDGGTLGSFQYTVTLPDVAISDALRNDPLILELVQTTNGNGTTKKDIPLVYSQ